MLNALCIVCFLFLLSKLMPRWKIKVVGAPQNRFEPVRHYYWLSQGSTFVAVSFILYSLLFNF